jgi:hypothetical protein
MRTPLQFAAKLARKSHRDTTTQKLRWFWHTRRKSDSVPIRRPSTRDGPGCRGGKSGGEEDGESCDEEEFVAQASRQEVDRS